MSNQPIPLFLAPCDSTVDLSKAAESLRTFLKQQKKKVIFYSPICANSQKTNSIEKVEELLSKNKFDEFLEDIVDVYQAISSDVDFVIVNPLQLHDKQPYAAELNRLIAEALDAAIIFVASEQAINQIPLNYNMYRHAMPSPRILGFMLQSDALEFPTKENEIYRNKNFPLLALFPKSSDITAAKYADASFWQILASTNAYETRITPSLFRTRLIQSAKKAQKSIVLPEGDEPRTLRAAVICTERKIAKCILLGNKEKIYVVAKQINLEIPEGLDIIDPTETFSRYVDPLVELRKNKGLSKEDANKQLQDPVVVGTMMLYLNEVDGLVSGAIHTTANTIRPALQIIKTVPESKIVSSVFFACLPEQVLVYGDCAVNPNPTAEELADIAIQSANSAAAFKLPVRIAMLSYSTGTSGSGESVDKVKEATALVKSIRPDLMIEGPIQYDAAVDLEVAHLKLPNSQVAGHATVFIFPDLNSGNICCKAVQRSTNTVLIGPMLQGLRKPVNDLSRGCLVDDIVFTIALTATQAI